MNVVDISKLVSVLVLGVIEGLTEFFPISSTGHRVFFGSFFELLDDSFKMFIIIVQLGPIISVAILFRYRMYHMIETFFKNFICIKYCNIKHLCYQHILIGSCPGIILGAVYYDRIVLMFEPIYVVYGLILGGIFLLISDLYSVRSSYVLQIDNITYLQAFLIGCFQCLAFFPGFSRFGATVGGGLLIGLDRRASLEFSFFLAIPIIFGSVVLTIYYYRFFFNVVDIFLSLIGCVVSFVISFITIKYFLKIIQNISLIPFIIYRFILAGSIYWKLMDC